MKQRFFNVILVILLLTLLASCVSIKTTKALREENALLKEYVIATESFLDTLNDEYDWVDAYDPYDYYDAVGNLMDKGLLPRR